MFNISRNSLHSPSDDNTLDSNITFIVFPDGIEVEVDHDAESTMLSLLPKIAKTHRLRLHRNEYEFHVSEEDQQKLMLASPIIDLHQKVKDVPTNTFYIRKKVSSISKKLTIAFQLFINTYFVCVAICQFCKAVKEIWSKRKYWI